MFTFIKNYNKKFKDANNWIALSLIREEQKQALQAVVQPQEGIQIVPQTMTTEQVVFTRDDMGHNQEEAHQIEQIYTELDKVPFSPVLAF